MQHITKLLLLLLPLCQLQAQYIDLSAVCSDIRQHNTQLRALRQSSEAQFAALQSENTLGETSVEYSPFFRSGVNGLASSELIVSQEFKFPTLFKAQQKANNLQHKVWQKEYDIAYRDIVLAALDLCSELTAALQTQQLIGLRSQATDSLLLICHRRMQQGDATIMELNTIRLDSMTLLTESAKNQGTIAQLQMQLQQLGVALSSLQPSTTPSNFNVQDIISTSGEIHLAQANLTQAEQELSLSRQQWLPSFTIGYRRNTERHEPSANGPLVGLSIPLFSNSSKVKAARLRHTAAQYNLEHAQSQNQLQRQTLQTQQQSLQRQLQTYDTALLHSTLQTLMRATNAGQISITQYYVEANRIYSLLQEKIDIENQLHKSQTRLQTL